MKATVLSLAVVYLRLSDEEKRAGESASIVNQRMIIEAYCERHSITMIREFTDDGFSGGNFARPGFQAMMEFLEKNQANIVITKDLSRLGRDMREASYYAEQFFPEHGIRYIAPNDNFDTDHDNPMAPFQFAMNEVYLRDGSKKVRNVLQAKREKGQYCACPPYGYVKAEKEPKLEPDQETAYVVQLIFQRAAEGESSRKIAEYLDEQNIVPPLKYRALYRDNFSEQGAARASDQWNWTTVKRMLRNEVYLGHTLLGKTRKVSVKSDKKAPVPYEDWSVKYDTHEPLITQEVYALAQRNLANNTRSHYEHPQVRRSIFSKVAYCAKCGHAMCSGGSVYKGEREKYWYLACNNIRVKGEAHCDGVRIRYYDLLELVRQDLNQLLALSEDELMKMSQEAVDRLAKQHNGASSVNRLKAAQQRVLSIDKIVGKLYSDNAQGKLSDDRLERMVADLEKESAVLQKQVAGLSVIGADPAVAIRQKYESFCKLAKQYTQIDTLDRKTLLTFVERIEIGPKILPDGITMANQHISYQQEVTISYRFLGALSTDTAPREIARAASF